MVNFLLATLCCTTFLINLNLVNAEERILYTKSSGEYTDWIPAPASQQLKFKIRAKAFTLNLATYPVNEFPKIEIGVSHPTASNTGVIWRDNVDIQSVKIKSHQNASEDKFNSYWVTWYNNRIKIGLEGELEPFLSWDDHNPFPINYIGVHTIKSDNKGIWIFDQGFTFPKFHISF